MKKLFFEMLQEQLDDLQKSGLYKVERIINSPQGGKISSDGSTVINLCSNNYLGLCNHPQIVSAAQESLNQYGFGMASVRFICGTLDLHKKLESLISEFLSTEDAIIFNSCFDANSGLFETLLDGNDAVISANLNHASIIDGIRLCKAHRFRFRWDKMQDLEEQLQRAQGCRHKLICTDGVFSMDGTLAPLDEIADLAEKYGAILMVDDSHAVGFMGPGGRGSHDYYQIPEKVDILTGTLGKALGGACGGYVAARKEVIQVLRQRSRPYLFSNTLAPIVAASAIEAIHLVRKDRTFKNQLDANASYFRGELTRLGFELIPGSHPIIPVMIPCAKLATRFANQLLEEGVYVIAFSYPVVPEGRARIRTQMSAELSWADLEKAAAAFEKVGRNLGII